MSLGSMSVYNKIGDYSKNSYNPNNDKIPMFNYGIDQTATLRRLGGTYKDNKYISEEYREEACPNNVSCYGGSIIFTKEGKIRDETKYFKYDDLQRFPTTSKDKYYTLKIPLNIHSGDKFIKLELSNLTFDKTYYSRKVTYTFWIKFLGFSKKKWFILIGNNRNNFTDLTQGSFFFQILLFKTHRSE